jgi:hypothetical protein
VVVVVVAVVVVVVVVAEAEAVTTLAHINSVDIPKYFQSK